MLVYPLGCLQVIQEHTNPLRRSPHGPLGLSRSQKRSRGSQDPSSSDQNLWSVHGCFMVQPVPNPETKGIFEENIHGLMIMAHINVQLVSVSEVNSQNNQNRRNSAVQRTCSMIKFNPSITSKTCVTKKCERNASNNKDKFLVYLNRFAVKKGNAMKTRYCLNYPVLPSGNQT